MNIVILHNAVASHESPEDQDTLTQAAAISPGIWTGWAISRSRCPARWTLRRSRESLLAADAGLGGQPGRIAGRERLACPSRLPHSWSSLGLPYTGSHTEALFTTNHKLIAKRTMRQAGLPTPRWMSLVRDPA